LADLLDRSVILIVCRDSAERLPPPPRHPRDEERVATGFRDLAGHFDETYRRLERLDHEYVAITQALRRIEGRAP